MLDTTEQHPPSACDLKQCSEHGNCHAGKCRCDSGYVGNPDALHGCQALQTGSPCDTTCGLNAYCDGGACVCSDGFVAVCSTGDCIAAGRLCDGTSDCPNAADEDPLVCFDGSVQQWSTADGCDDGRPIQWRVWAQERDWVWPGPDAVFSTAELDVVDRERIECVAGELLCFGAQAGDRTWGVGLDGAGECEDCCQPCASAPVDMGVLTCD